MKRRKLKKKKVDLENLLLYSVYTNGSSNESKKKVADESGEIGNETTESHFNINWSRN